ncbi:MAG: YebC/PmpR family DNA-binding transcriptional regulator [Halobacteriovoraceae bacterium]|nr:YebC/PmpR family DNA-binding transcriptional regulator [Halobacteriovoraceae bacterium]MBC99493.1 YebC/PmpR family DNA-binding transcriptional regulator [Halobacteriovoraceae bacterium]|tara:strand:+ start:216973 stop:217710 length:738 start_codon:yes stop_codon:yes gene_type:complete
MAGHSKWANIRHRKGAQDAKRGKIFTKLIKEITVAVKNGGPDAETNPRLRLALQNARGQNMPKDNIERAIKKASGADGTEYTETTFEGYGPDGVAVFVECATDNNTRTVGNVRSYFRKFGGNLGKDGCLEFVFNRKGIFTLEQGELEEDEFTMEMIDGGAEDVEFEEGIITVTTEMEDFGTLQKKLQDMDLEPKEAGLQRIPLTMKEISKDTFETFSKLIDALEDDDDVQKVYHNVEFNEEFMAD